MGNQKKRLDKLSVNLSAEEQLIEALERRGSST
jgi:hypothetical protein